MGDFVFIWSLEEVLGDDKFVIFLDGRSFVFDFECVFNMIMKFLNKDNIFYFNSMKEFDVLNRFDKECFVNNQGFVLCFGVVIFYDFFFIFGGDDWWNYDICVVLD